MLFRSPEGRGPEGRGREAVGRAHPGVAGRRTGLNLAEATARAIGERLAAHSAPEPVSRPLAAWQRRERPVEASAGMRRRRHSRRQGTRTAVGSVKMPPPCESPDLAAVEGALRHSPSASESGLEQLPVPSRPRLRDLLSLLRSGLTLGRKCGAAGGLVSGRSGHARRARGARAHPPGRPRGASGSWGGAGGGALGRREAPEGGVVGCPRGAAVSLSPRCT